MLSSTPYNFPSMVFFSFVENAIHGYKNFINTRDVMFFILIFPSGMRRSDDTEISKYSRKSECFQKEIPPVIE